MSVLTLPESLLASPLWRRASPRAKGVWVSLADACRQVRAEGRLAGLRLRTELAGWCRVAGVVAGDVRAVVGAGLAVYEGDDLVLMGWSGSPGGGAPRVGASSVTGVERSLSPGARRARAYRARQAGRLIPEAGCAEPTDDRNPITPDRAASVPAFVTGGVTDGVTDRVTPGVTGVTEPVTDDVTHVTTVTPPAHAVHISSGDEKERTNARTFAVSLMVTSPGVPRHAAAHSEDRAQRDAGRDVTAPVTPRATRSVTPSVTRPVPPATPGAPPPRLPHVVAAHRRAVRAAALDNDPLALVTALGAIVAPRAPDGRDLTSEWLAAFGSEDARVVLAICCQGAELPRLPSRYRLLAERWRGVPIVERRRQAHALCAALDLPSGKRGDDGSFSAPRFVGTSVTPSTPVPLAADEAPTVSGEATAVSTARSAAEPAVADAVAA